MSNDTHDGPPPWPWAQVAEGHRALSMALDQAIDSLDGMLAQLDSGNCPTEIRALSRVLRDYIYDHMPAEDRLITDILGPAHPAYHRLSEALEGLQWQMRYLHKMVENEAPSVDWIVIRRQSQRVLSALTAHSHTGDALMAESSMAEGD
ncbi:MAG: hypothetical protein ACE366_21945 [Bradymonadia bacterium]